VLQNENDFDVTTEESGSGLRSDKRTSDSWQWWLKFLQMFSVMWQTEQKKPKMAK
jgi:hypothetical protein